MRVGRVIVGIAAGALVALGAVVAPAFGASERTAAKPVKRSALRSVGGFTPASGDPRLAALLARGGFDPNGFHFTPADTRRDTRAVTVAVRARSIRAADTGRTDLASNSTVVGLAPIAYNLGAAVGWKRFALAGDVTRVDLQGLPGGREGADVAVSYTGNRWSGRVKAAADRPTDGTPKAIAELPSYSVDLGGSYSLTHNLDVTAGLRYRSDRERLTRTDDRRDSQAVYVGTAFRF
ncbi:hypothetical protein [Sphingomonas abaci]|uniref:Porin domain-containing protein n=1 Tax=Sphingomonas abaci TaxID=237611 RepID=A0A7W7AJK2_9SPHN|nr:hypothetical protein [Sphingomonas abaci]MBB4618238.1 hypothetical protein [Sphingomonas abaci]